MSDLSISRLRANLYRIVDRVIASGQPVEVRRGEHRVRLSRLSDTDGLSTLEPHPDYVRGDPEDLVHMDWSREWRE